MTVRQDMRSRCRRARASASGSATTERCCPLTESLSRAQRGQPGAFEQVVAGITPSLLGLFRGWPAFRMRFGCGEEQLADVLQQVFLAVWEHLPQFDPRRGSAGAWIRSIAHNIGVSLLRAGARRRTVPLEWDLPDDDTDPSADLAAREEQEALAQRVEEYLAAKGEPTRRAWELIVVQGMSYGEASRTLGVPQGTLATRLHRARQALIAASSRRGD
jgi:RNA polymerase sigma-70 factor (ECF subfamily)